MSDVKPTDEGTNQAASAKKGTNPLRLVLLLLIFGLALAGLLYDYTVARPGLKAADDAIQGLLSGNTKDPNNDGSVTEDEVQLTIGRKPNSTEALSNGKIEIYSWRSGLPYRTYDLYVVYSGKNTPLLHSATTNARPTGEQLPPETVLQKALTEDEIKNFTPPTVMAAGAGSGKKRSGGKKGKGKTSAKPDDKSGAAAAKEQPPADPTGAEEPKEDASPAKNDSNDDAPAKEGDGES